MGLYTRNTLHQNPELLTKAEIDEFYTWQERTPGKPEVVRSAMVGSTYYAAIKITELSTEEAETAAAVAWHTPTTGTISTLELRRWGKFWTM